MLLPFVSTASERTGERLNCVLNRLADEDIRTINTASHTAAGALISRELPVELPVHVLPQNMYFGT